MCVCQCVLYVRGVNTIVHLSDQNSCCCDNASINPQLLLAALFQKHAGEAKVSSPVAHGVKRRKSLFDSESEEEDEMPAPLHSTLALNDKLAASLHAFEHLARFSRSLFQCMFIYACGCEFYSRTACSLGECLIVLQRWKDAIRTYKKLKATERPILLSSIWRRLRLLQVPP